MQVLSITVSADNKRQKRLFGNGESFCGVMEEIMKEKMNVCKWLKEVIVFLVIAIMVVGMALFVKVDSVSKGCEVEKYASEQIVEGISLKTAFVPSKDYLKEIGIIVNREAKNIPGTISVTVYDMDGNVVGDSTRPLSEMTLGYINAFEVNCSLNPGEEYMFMVTAEDYEGVPITIDMVSASAGSSELLECTIGGKVLDNAVPLTEFTYKVPADFYAMRPYVFCIFIFGILLMLAVENKKKMTMLAKAGMYVFFVLAVSTLILMNDEGSKPLVYKGTELIHEEGGEDFRGYLTIDASSEFHGILANTEKYMLKKGNYTLQVSYQTDTSENTVEVYNDGNKEQEFSLNAHDTYAAFPFTLQNDTQNVEIRFYYYGNEMLKLNQLSIIPEHAFYNDQYFFLGLFLALNIVGLLLYMRNKKKPFAINSIIDVCFVAGAAILCTLPLFTNTMVRADDLCYHLLRIEGIKDGMLDGQWPVVIMPNAMSGNGYLNSTYPYLFLFIPAFMRMGGVSIALSYKFLIFLANIATGVHVF